jgi:hypothetical protein
MQQKGNVEWKVAVICGPMNQEVAVDRAGTTRSAIVICQSSSFVKTIDRRCSEDFAA